MGVLVSLVVDDTQDLVRCEGRVALVAVAQRALPNDPIRSVVDAIVDEAVLGEDVEFEASFVSVNAAGS